MMTLHFPCDLLCRYFLDIIDYYYYACNVAGIIEKSHQNTCGR